MVGCPFHGRTAVSSPVSGPSSYNKVNGGFLPSVSHRYPGHTPPGWGGVKRSPAAQPLHGDLKGPGAHRFPGEEDIVHCLLQR